MLPEITNKNPNKMNMGSINDVPLQNNPLIKSVGIIQGFENTTNR